MNRQDLHRVPNNIASDKHRQSVALVELGGSHAETLHSQIRWLNQAGHRVHVICNPHLVDMLTESQCLEGQLSITTRERQKSPWVALNQFRQIHKYCRTHGIRRLILNTAEINEVRYLVVFSKLCGLRCDGILHNGMKLKSSWLLRGLARAHMHRVLVMHDLVRTHVPRMAGVSVESFYPIYFPNLDSNASVPNACVSNGSDPVPRDDHFRICILGTLSSARKDSMALAQELQNQRLPSNVHVEVLGHVDRNSDPEVYDLLSRAPCFGNQFHGTAGFKSATYVHQQLRNADLILPLLYPRSSDRFYGDGRVSGAMNAAFAFKVPMLMDDSWRGVPDYEASSFFHARYRLLPRIEELANAADRVEAMKDVMRANPQFDERFQGERYRAFLNL